MQLVKVAGVKFGVFWLRRTRFYTRMRMYSTGTDARSGNRVQFQAVEYFTDQEIYVRRL